MNSFDTAILEFARRWMPYGGPPPDEIWVEFGMNSRRYEQHLLAILDTIASRSIPPNDRAILRAQLSKNVYNERYCSDPL